MATKTALKKKTFENLIADFGRAVDGLSAAENGLNSRAVKRAFYNAMKKHFVLINDLGEITKDNEPASFWNQQEPGFDY